MIAAQRPTASLAGDLAAALDPVRFAERLGITPDPWQAEVLRSGAHRSLLLASRQSGKSTTTAIMALHHALYHAASLVLLLSPSLRQSGELFRVVSGLYSASGGDVTADAQTLLRLELSNGSRILSLPATEHTVRGLAGASLVVFDEAARVPDGLYRAVLPMTATTRGRVVALSTPFGRRGWFADAWHDGGDGWQRWNVPATLCPRIDPDWLEEQRQSMGAFWFDQEFMCAWLDAESQAFRGEDVRSTLIERVEEWAL